MKVVIVSAGLSAIPQIGGPLQTVFDAVVERRRYRVESTMREIIEDVGEDRLSHRLIEDLQFEAVLGEALEAAAKSGFEAKRRLLGRALINALQDDATIDDAVVMVSALSQLEPVHVRALALLAAAVPEGDGAFVDRTAVDEFNKSQPTPVLATLEVVGAVIPASSWTGRGLGAETISDFGRKILRELKAVAEEDMERLIGH